MKENKSISINRVLETLEAENEAFLKAGLEVGTVEYQCPHCRGTAVANRYWYDGRIHGLGSGCKTCDMWHS